VDSGWLWRRRIRLLASVPVDPSFQGSFGSRLRGLELAVFGVGLVGNFFGFWSSFLFANYDEPCGFHVGNSAKWVGSSTEEVILNVNRWSIV